MGTILRPEGGGAGLTRCLFPLPAIEHTCSPQLLEVWHWELSKFEERTLVAGLGSVLWQLPQFSCGDSDGWPQT